MKVHEGLLFKPNRTSRRAKPLFNRSRLPSKMTQLYRCELLLRVLAFRIKNTRSAWKFQDRWDMKRIMGRLSLLYRPDYYIQGKKAEAHQVYLRESLLPVMLRTQTYTDSEIKTMIGLAIWKRRIRNRLPFWYHFYLSVSLIRQLRV